MISAVFALGCLFIAVAYVRRIERDTEEALKRLSEQFEMIRTLAALTHRHEDMAGAEGQGSSQGPYITTEPTEPTEAGLFTDPVPTGQYL